jgi:hypothetical protein
MPDENRSECLPYCHSNEPPLQRALLEFLAAQYAKPSAYADLLADERFGRDGKWPLMRALESLDICGLIVIGERGRRIAATRPAWHSHWLLTEVETPDA